LGLAANPALARFATLLSRTIQPTFISNKAFQLFIRQSLFIILHLEQSFFSLFSSDLNIVYWLAVAPSLSTRFLLRLLVPASFYVRRHVNRHGTRSRT